MHNRGEWFWRSCRYKTNASRSLNREGASCSDGVSSRLSSIQYTLFKLSRGKIAWVTTHARLSLNHFNCGSFARWFGRHVANPLVNGCRSLPRVEQRVRRRSRFDSEQPSQAGRVARLSQSQSVPLSFVRWRTVSFVLFFYKIGNSVKTFSLSSSPSVVLHDVAPASNLLRAWRRRWFPEFSLSTTAHSFVS